MARRDKSPPPVYECRPPEWLPKSHNSADLGYVGFFPPRPDQEEEILTETNVKNGITQGYSVPIETYSAQDSVHNQLGLDETLSELEELMNQVFSRRASNIPAVPVSSFKLPSRVTLNDSRRRQWFADLANTQVPLHKLGKSVPHGAKGHDLLDLLHQHDVAVPRAVWFLRVFGANETTGLRNKPTYNPTQYSVEWANVVTGYIRKQLTDIALPMAPRPGLNIKVTFKGVLADQDSREKWLNRFTYCLKLLRAFYSEGLVDNRTFLAWLVQQTSTCNLAQLGFVARLADEYLDGMLVCRALTRPFAEACLHRLSEVNAFMSDHLTSLITTLKTLIMRTFLASSDAFVSPRMWMQYSGLFQELISERLGNDAAEDKSQNEDRLAQTFSSHSEDVRRRNEAMLFRNLPARIRGTLSSALADIKKLLNAFSGNSDIDSISYFDACLDDPACFARKLDILLTWSVTPLQFGDHRGYVAATLLQSYSDRAEERAIRRGRDPPEDVIQDHLFEWLDSSKAAGDATTLPNVAVLYGQLLKRGIFSYPQYIQRLIARGEQGLLVTEVRAMMGLLGLLRLMGSFARMYLHATETS
ncbi:hypothetical protein NM688_g388 [Phlebia brevispora]|uniref:Uncharacterized protein n=1 Tax=Phlebia brevispora TaxID=194682 RepID=A0ACC1TE51_9APHY|nr:hypothetical protein NM688_g388 [Phlebia brevispora]